MDELSTVAFAIQIRVIARYIYSNVIVMYKRRFYERI